MSKFRNFLRPFIEDPYTPKKKQQILSIVRRCMLAITLILAVAIPMFLIRNSYRLAMYTTAASILMLFCYGLTKLTGSLELGRALTGLLMTCIYTLTFLFGPSDGFGANWMLLMPCLTMYLLGFSNGVIISLYFWGLLFFCTKIPGGYDILKYPYSDRFLSILFIILTVETVFSTICMYAYYKNQLKIKEMEEDLEKAVLEEHEKLADISLKTILVISNTVEAKDEYTSQHSHRVADFSCMIARKLGWSEEQIAHLRNIALLHDIGKISVPESVLNKPGKLTDEEYEQIKRHTTTGGEILHELTLIPHVDLGAEFHHERYDSRGYPSGLAGTDIPFEARIIGIADSFDAMRYRRIYRGECDPDYILGELNKGRGTQFDPELLDVFLEVIEEENLLSK